MLPVPDCSDRTARKIDKHVLGVPLTLMMGRRYFLFEERRETMAIPTIDMVRTGQNIHRLRKQAGVSVKDLQDVFGFATPQAIYKWQHGD